MIRDTLYIYTSVNKINGAITVYGYRYTDDGDADYSDVDCGRTVFIGHTRAEAVAKFIDDKNLDDDNLLEIIIKKF